jgi:hypothetical protein
MIVTGLTAAAIKSHPATFDHDDKRQLTGLAITNRRLRKVVHRSEINLAPMSATTQIQEHSSSRRRKSM